MSQVLGIEIVRTGIKGAPVDLDSGRLIAERVELDTAHSARPKVVANLVRRLVVDLEWTGQVGITFPGAVENGVVVTSSFGAKWIGVNATEAFATATGLTIRVVNEADAVGLAEMRFGAGKDEFGTVLVLTFDSEIGSALFSDGRLIPNSEFGQVEVSADKYHRLIPNSETGQFEVSADKLGKKAQREWGKWSGRVDKCLANIEDILSPRLIIIGGIGPKTWQDSLALFRGLHARVAPSLMDTEPRIVGAAVAVR
jgi:polyphosphate glucokinase